MAKFFTTEEIAILESSPYVISASERFIYFTIEFKRLFYDKYMETRKPKRIVEEMGFDATLLGASRIHSITMHIVKEYETQGFFADQIMRRNGGMSPEMADKFKVKRLETELARTKQEVEHLKKITSLRRKGTTS